MKKLIESKIFHPKGIWVIHPILLAVFPILFMYSANIIETKISQVILPLVISVVGASFLFFILTLLMKNIIKAGLATTIFLTLFYSYGRIYDRLDVINIFVPQHFYFLPLFILFWGYCIYFLLIIKRDFKNTTKILNFVAVVLIAVNLFNIVWYTVSNSDIIANSFNNDNNSSSIITNTTTPDIYYIILDGYNNPNSIEENYQYDNSKFVEFLINHDFYYADKSQTRFQHTHNSLATSLNMEYVYEDVPTEEVFNKIKTNNVETYLRSKSYKYVLVGTYWTPTVSSPDADISVNFYKSGNLDVSTSGYLAVLANTTMLKPFYNNWFGNQNQLFYRQGLLDTLDYLKNVTEIQSPKFVFAHLICPHPPYVFDADGGFVETTNWFSDESSYYFGQYAFITQQIEEVIESLLSNSKEPPIIVLQSDHGTGPIWPSILNAYHLPNFDEELLYSSISPVNTFRLIFDYYFGADYALLDE